MRQAQAAVADTDRAAHEADVQAAPGMIPTGKGPVPLSGREQRRDLVEVATGPADQLDAGRGRAGPSAPGQRHG